MIINFVLILSVLLGCCSIALDIGLLQLKQLQIQNAADAAALGAAFEYNHGKTDYNAAAIAEAGQNGFVNGSNNVNVATTIPPATGVYANNMAAVQVTVSQAVTPIFRIGSYNISATSTALGPPCVYFMSTDGSPTTLTVSNSNVQINCAAYSGYNAYTDSGVVVSFDAFYLAGPMSASSLSGTVMAGSTGYYPTFNAPLLSDPLAQLTSPTFSGFCNQTGKSISSGATILFPGTYCGTSSKRGLTITGGTVIFNSGLYTFTGGVSITGATISGTGATFFLTKGNGAGYGQFIAGSSSTTTTVSLTAPSASTAGTLASILIFGDRAWTGSNQDVIFNNVTFNVEGVIYMTNTGMSFANGRLNSTKYFGMVLDNFSMSGSNATISGDYSGVTGGSPYRPSVGLAE